MHARDDYEAFRTEVRAFFAEEYPQDIIVKLARGASPDKSDYQRSEQAIGRKGWLAASWPVEYGGTGWDPLRRYIFEEELERAGALNLIPMGLVYVAPVIYTFGTEAQKQRWLPDILASRSFWCQGYSEPDAGSDLRSLRCRAERQGDEYVVTGTKIWTSYAQHADWIFCLVRTEPTGAPKPAISFLCIDMRSEGIRVYPIISIDGKHHLNRVEFDQVRVPLDNRIGDEGDGWVCAKHLLTHERTSYAHVGAKHADLERLKFRLRQWRVQGVCGLLDDPLFAARLARAEIRLMALESMVLRALADVAAGHPSGLEVSMIKILATESAQQITSLYLEAAGPNGWPCFEDAVLPDWGEAWGLSRDAVTGTARYYFDRAQSIYGGSNEIQRNLIAKHALGL